MSQPNLPALDLSAVEGPAEKPKRTGSFAKMGKKIKVRGQSSVAGARRPGCCAHNAFRGCQISPDTRGYWSGVPALSALFCVHRILPSAAPCGMPRCAFQGCSCFQGLPGCYCHQRPAFAQPARHAASAA